MSEKQNIIHVFQANKLLLSTTDILLHQAKMCMIIVVFFYWYISHNQWIPNFKSRFLENKDLNNKVFSLFSVQLVRLAFDPG